MLSDDFEQRLATRVGLHWKPHFVDHLQVLIELGASIERRAERGNVHIEDAPAHIRDLGQQLGKPIDILGP